MNTVERLSQQCLADGSGNWLCAPFRAGPWLAASDRIALSAVIDETEAPKVKDGVSGQSWIETDGLTLVDLDALLAFCGAPGRDVIEGVQECAECKGTGRNGDCPRCGGEGSHECTCSSCGDEHGVDCRACDGTGAAEYCAACKGKGSIEGSKPRLGRIRGKTFNLRRLARALDACGAAGSALMGFAAAGVAHPLVARAHPLVVRGGTWAVVLMPYTYGPDDVPVFEEPGKAREGK